MDFPESTVDLISALEEFGLCLDEHGDSDDENVDVQLEGLDQVGIIPSWQQINLTLRDVSYNFITGLRKDAEAIRILIENKNEDEQHSVKDPANTLGLREAEDVVLFEDREEEKKDYEENEVDAEEEDDLEEIGRLPSFYQLQFTLRNATDIISSGMFGRSVSQNSDYFSPSDLLARWGGPVGGGGLGWYNFMQNIQLPSFLAENSEDDVPPDLSDLDVHPDLYSSEGITEEEMSVGYNNEGLTGCEHYLRNCKTECNICKKFFGCQLCHDEIETHEMDRRKVRRMLCLYCKRPQPPSRKCLFCREIMGDYYCDKCRLWNDDPEKPIYHCNECNLCRVGRGHGIDTFHCDKCGICMALTVKDNHKCIERAANSGCPICLEDLFSSTKPTVFMPCGHPIHSFCFNEYTKRYYRCPICAKSIFDTSALFRMVDDEVRCEVLPPELANKRVRIVCQDCRLKSRTDFHLAGLKCGTCGSYNTTEV